MMFTGMRKEPIHTFTSAAGSSYGSYCYVCMSASACVYILKIKGKAKIPDYVQIRDDQFTLLAYFRVDRPEKALAKCGLGDKEKELIRIISEIPFGKVIKLDV